MLINLKFIMRCKITYVTRELVPRRVRDQDQTAYVILPV
jgi:hypothetical protein